MTTELPLRRITAGEFDTYARLAYAAFGERPQDEDVARERAIFELDRTLAAFDGDRMVATSGLFSTSLRIPGDDLPVAVVTAVSVARAYRRRGLLTRMMRGLVDDARGRGEVLAALFASESAIYGRFGFAPATHELNVRIDRRVTRFRPELPPTGTVRAVDPADAGELCARVYATARTQWTAMCARTPAWFDYQVLGDPSMDREGYGEKEVVVHDNGDGVDGYAVTRLKVDWDAGLPHGTLDVVELMAATPAAHAALWRYCLDTDLVETVRADRRPRDEPLDHVLADPRRLRRTLVDGMWLRLLDVPAALSARAWTGSDRLHLLVRDPFLPENAGTWSLEVADGKAACSKTTSDPDLELDVEALASLYLGGARPPSLRAAGRLRERREGAAARLDALLGTTPTPWAPEIF